MNPQLASRALAREERPQLLSSQADTPWGAAISEGEIIVLGTPVLKRRFLSVLAETWVRTLLRFKARLVDEARAR
ncbi:hypothetical protein EMIHUDRAFT_239030 [Emiliania huxleyi CCMP1516]|uniref:Uncharacterized protein n=2 Tax=Emiliania huxleyi TaxID=2903 RepID=A0A0D3JK41_EMIH1|nr:hypothetical protein EMIHUDRAFT_239030 [Emiliania huxleyi CCMP1516]EOD23876.1 hypothetical protein EMIHUDRAFT_239030 [Emiliania huxleyi CCMP1516]|eukprot:XP_005776305.1 hypothetical protein EMIHUDRAFT_239030 [Emiliania huxleyi CCMP1516]